MASTASAYTELHLHSHFSFLDGASPPEAYAARAAALGMDSLALTDHQGLYGAVRFARACEAEGVRPIFGAEVDLEGAGHLTLLVESAEGWANLCRMLSAAGLAGTKRERPVSWAMLEAHAGGLVCLSGCREGALAAPARRGDRAATLERARRLRGIFGPGRLYVELQRHLDRGDRRLNATLIGLAEHLGLPLVATNNVHYATRADFPLQQVLTGIRLGQSLDEAGSALYATPHRQLKGAAEMAALFPDQPEAIANSRRIAERCGYRLDLRQARLPAFPVPAGETAYGQLLALAYAGLRARYDPVTPRALEQLARELGVIERAGLADYFLLVKDLVDFARGRGILCQGRGSAAGSLVAYVLGITPVDPLAHDLLFERFLAEGATSIPDIDIDFAAGRREEVIQYVYQRYGPEHTGMVANVVTFRARSALADVGKALGFPAPLLAELRQALHTRDAGAIAPDLAEVEAFRARMGHLPWQQLLALCARIEGYPRHLSIHSGGMLVTAEPLAGLVPLERATMPGRVVVQWDKDDVADAGLIKIDLLGLRSLDLVAEAFERIAAAGGPALTLDDLPPEDPAVWEMLGAADTLGCFQVESRAQMNLLPRLRPGGMADLIVEVALIRPGPVQGGMARAYLQRRDGDAPVTYWHPALAPVLAETLGVVVFQEQVLKVAMVLAGFGGGQADGLRRAMSRKRSRAEMARWQADFVAGAAARGLAAVEAETIFGHLMGFAGYGFCKSHAAAFALLAYATCWLKRHHPLPFYAALLNAQPMGFYSVGAVVQDARRHAIAIRPLDVNRSGIRWEVEEGALRVPLGRLKGLGAELAERIVAAREADGPFADAWDFVRRVRPPRALAERLAEAGALPGASASASAEVGAGASGGTGDRRDALWALGEMHWGEGELDLAPRPLPAPLPATTAAEAVASEMALLGLAQGPHPVALARPRLAEAGVISSLDLAQVPEGQRVRVAGRLEVLQRPPSAKGLAFASLEDEHGLINLVFHPAVFERVRSRLRGPGLRVAAGEVQRERGGLHVVVGEVERWGGEKT